MGTSQESSPRGAGGGPARLPDRRTNALAVAFLLAGIAAGFALRPVAGPEGTALALGGVRLPTVCSFRLGTGLPCASCGLTRAVVLLLHGRLGDSWAAHPFGVPSLSLILLALPPRVAGMLGRRPGWVRRWDRAWAWAVAATLAAMLAWWGLRMLGTFGGIGS